MPRRPVHFLALFLITLTLVCFGLLGTSMGLALVLARFSTNPSDTTLVRSWLGVVVFGVGVLLLYAALYVAWLRRRRRPVDSE